MKKMRIFITVSALAFIFCMNGCSTQKLSKSTDQGSPNQEQNQVIQNETPQTEPNTESKDTTLSIEQMEPEITGKLSHDLSDAEGKDLTRVEYRYLSNNGEFLSVVASFGAKNPRQINEISITEMDSLKDTPRVSKLDVDHGRTYDDVLNLLYHIHNEKNAGILSWINHPERANWKEDKSTTWIVINFDDIQYIVSSRQDLPEGRYYAFYQLYKYLISLMPGYQREMRQDIGEPAVPVYKEVHGKEVPLIPGTYYGSGQWVNGELDYGDKKWWIEENLNDTFRATPKSLKFSKGHYDTFNDKKVTSADITIDDNGNFVLHVNGQEFIGSLSRERSIHAHFVYNDDRGQELFNRKGYLDTGDLVRIQYYRSKGYDEDHNEYVRLQLDFLGRPYVHGKAVPPTLIYLDRVKK